MGNIGLYICFYLLGLEVVLHLGKRQPGPQAPLAHQESKGIRLQHPHRNRHDIGTQTRLDHPEAVDTHHILHDRQNTKLEEVCRLEDHLLLIDPGAVLRSLATNEGTNTNTKLH